MPIGTVKFFNDDKDERVRYGLQPDRNGKASAVKLLRA